MQVLQKTKALLFDLDGTLIDTMPLHWATMHEVLGFFGVTCDQEYLNQFAGQATQKIVATINADHGYQLDPEAFRLEKARRFAARVHESKPIEPIVDIVLHYYRKLPMAIVSGGIASDVSALLKILKLSDHFDTIITGDDPIPPKPSPEIFLEAARRLKVDPTTCQVFEDADSGITAAKGAGMYVTDVRLFL